MSVAGHARLLLPMAEPPSAAWPDDRLVHACLAGDERAWNALIDKYKRLIYSIALRYHATPDDAADIFQAVCLELYSELPRVRDAAALRGWLITVTAHAALRSRRRRSRREEIERSDEDLSLFSGTESTPIQEREEFERAQAVREAMMRLTERCQAMLQMLFFEDPPRPYADVASTLGLATGSIGFIRGRCLEKLRKIVTEDDAA